jgi:hypothetical protein
MGPKEQGAPLPGAAFGPWGVYVEDRGARGAGRPRTTRVDRAAAATARVTPASAQHEVNEIGKIRRQ